MAENRYVEHPVTVMQSESPLSHPVGIVRLPYCLKCGAVVLDLSLHDEWHVRDAFEKVL